MQRAISKNSQAARRVRRHLRMAAGMSVLALLAACGGQPARHGRYSPTRYYPPPGPPSDPWGPYIREASGRFTLPEQWIRAVMRQESGGQEDVISSAGAMGLMQVMPETYNELRARYGLGEDPFDPHNNMLAGTAYLKEMYDRYGAPGFLAAYNAGPNRLDKYLYNGKPLPEETVQYVAAISPNLGPGTVMTGPLAVYAGGASRTTRYASAARRRSGSCDPDAAYDPTRPCRPRVVQVAATAPFVPGPPASVSGCDPDAAYDPTRPCRPAPVQVAAVPAPAPFVPGPPASATGCDPDAAYDPTVRCQPAPVVAAVATTATASMAATPVVAEPLAPPSSVLAARPAPPPSGFMQASAASPGGLRRPVQETMARPATYSPSPAFSYSPPPVVAAIPAPSGAWGIQVGAFATLSTAEAAAMSARAAAPDLLRTTKIELPATTPFGSQVAFRARLTGLTQGAAADACARLSNRGMACMTVPPARGTS